MDFGAHVSAAGGLWSAPERAANIGCEIFQFFTRPPQGGAAPPITAETVEKFKEAVRKFHMKSAYVHAPYFLNLASINQRIRHGSIKIIREDLERASLLGCQALMFHPGSAKDAGQKKGEEFIREGLNQILEGYDGSCRLLIEISAGAGMVMGDTFEEISFFLKGAERGSEIGVCFDTQHAFASGYDLRTQETVQKTLDLFDRIIGLNRLILFHANDSQTDFESHRDRHEHLGKGKIGVEAFRSLVQNHALKKVNMIVETPFKQNCKGVEEDLLFLKNLREKT